MSAVSWLSLTMTGMQCSGRNAERFAAKTRSNSAADSSALESSVIQGVQGRPVVVVGVNSPEIGLNHLYAGDAPGPQGGMNVGDIVASSGTKPELPLACDSVGR